MPIKDIQDRISEQFKLTSKNSKSGKWLIYSIGAIFNITIQDGGDNYKIQITLEKGDLNLKNRTKQIIYAIISDEKDHSFNFNLINKDVHILGSILNPLYQKPATSPKEAVDHFTKAFAIVANCLWKQKHNA